MTVRWWPAERVEAAMRWTVAVFLSLIAAFLVGLAIVAFVSAQNLAHEAIAGRNQTSKAASKRITALTAQVGALTDQVVQLRDQLIADGQVPAVALPARQAPTATTAATTTTVRRPISSTTVKPPRTTTTAAPATTTAPPPSTTTTTTRPQTTTTTTAPCRIVSVAGACIGG